MKDNREHIFLDPLTQTRVNPFELILSLADKLIHNPISEIHSIVLLEMDLNKDFEFMKIRSIW